MPRRKPNIVASAAVALEEEWTEAKLASNIVREAKNCGWRIFHPFLSKWSQKGYPDLTMVRNGIEFAWELKGPHGKLTPSQQEWLDALKQVPGVDARVVYPSELEKAYMALVAGKWPEGV